MLATRLGLWDLLPLKTAVAPAVGPFFLLQALLQPSSWALRCPRWQLLGRVQAALVQLAGAQQQLQQWQAGVGELAQELEEQLSSVMLFAVPALKVGGLAYSTHGIVCACRESGLCCRSHGDAGSE